MKIGFLQTYFAESSAGGAELHTEKLARELKERGHNVTIFTDKPQEDRKVLDLEVRKYPTLAKFNPITHLALGYQAHNDLKECDVVVLTDNSAWKAVDIPVPTVMVFHVVWHGWIQRNNLLKLLTKKPQVLPYAVLERKIASKVSHIVSISPNIEEDISTIKRSSKITHIPNGVDIDRFHPKNKATSDGDVVVYFQGRLVDTKNPDLLLKAAIQSEENWKLMIGGKGPLYDKLQSKIMEEGIEDRVELLGYVPDSELPRRYAEADIFALPSDYEGMPLTILEAAASGTAILASPIAATNFVTEEIGAIVDPDIYDIKNTLDRLSSQPRKLTKMGKNARIKSERYSWKNIALKYENLFQRINRPEL
jgi:glycosyltransferase involved in cell wall biosynthesis